MRFSFLFGGGARGFGCTVAENSVRRVARRQPESMLLCFAAWLASGLLSGCEAPLNLDGIRQEQQKPVHRFDHFQGAATNGNGTVVVGGAGVITVSLDEGVQWVRHELPGSPPLIDVTACPGDEFVALGFDRSLWISTDNGETWTSSKVTTPETPQAITCDPRGRIWVTASWSTILVSEDLGGSWTETSLDEDLMLTTIQFVNADTGFATGEFGVVLKTTDAGQNWVYQEPLPEEFYPQAALFTDGETGWVVGLNGQILHTDDGGRSWQRQRAGADEPLFGIAASTGTTGTIVAVGDNSTILRLASANWSTVHHQLPFPTYLRGVVALDSDRILVAGGDGALHIINLEAEPSGG